MPPQKKLIHENEGAIILDVREPKEAADSNVTGSINLPRGLLEMKIQNHCIEPNTMVLTHCAGGGRASLAAARLQEMGYVNVHAIAAKYDDIKKALG